MTITVTPPVPISANQQVSIQQPQYGQSLGLLVLDNLSEYLLQVSIGAATFYQAPLVENAYDISASNGQPIQVTGIPLADDPGLTGTLAPTWYGLDEQPLSSTWPIALSGPAEVAAATAAALLESGIPNVITTTTLGPIVIPANFPTAPITWVDVHKFATISIIDESVGPSTLNYVFSDAPSANPNVISQDSITAPATGGGPASTIPVTGPWLGMWTPDTFNHSVIIIGSNRQAAAPHPIGSSSGGGFSSTGFFGQTGNTAMVAGTAYPLANGIGDINQGFLFGGPAYAMFILSPSASLAKGYWRINLEGPQPGGASAPMIFTIADTTEAHIGPSQLNIYKMIALPQDQYTLTFFCTVAGTANVQMLAIPNY